MSIPGEVVSIVPEVSIPDRSWLDEAIEMPSVPFRDLLRDNLTPAGISIAYSVGHLCLHMVDNCRSSQQIPYGANLPIPSEEDKYGGVLKVIREYRTLHRGFNPFANWGNIGDEEAFNRQTKHMEEEKLYMGNSAKLNVQFDDDEQTTSLVRTVGYYDAAPSRKQLGGIPSNFIHSCDSLPVYATLLLSPVKVGTAYKHGPRGTSKVIAAEIIKPADIKPPHKTKAARRSVRFPSLNLLPKPALDLH